MRLNNTAVVQGNARIGAIPLNSDNPNLPADRFLRANEIGQYLGVHEKTPWRWAAETKSGHPRANGFPQPIRLGPGISVWRLSEVNAWIASKTEAA